MKEAGRWSMGILLFCAMLAALAGELYAQMPGRSPSIILSKGMTIHRIDDPSRLPSTFNGIRDDRLIVPVASGKLLLRFEDKTLRSSTGDRQLVLTEDGIWGFAPVNQKVFEAEPRLRDIYSSGDQYVIVQDDFTISLDQLTAPVRFGRGEIYSVSKDADPSSQDTITVMLPEDKRKDILLQNPRASGKELTQSVSLPSMSLLPVDIAQALPADVYFGKDRKTTPAEYGKIYGSWIKAVPETRLSSFKLCGESVVRSDTNTGSHGFEIKGSFGGEAPFWEWFKATGGISGELARKSESVIKKIYKTSDQIELVIKAWHLKRNNDDHIFFLVRNRKCENDSVWYSIQSQDQGSINFQPQQMGDLNQCFTPSTGLITLRCYADYLNMMHQLSNNFDLSEQEVGFILARIGRVQDWRKFF